jgi:hypothetical protein
LLLLVSVTMAYDRWALIDGDPLTPDDPPNYNACYTCHGDFNSGTYTDAGSGTSWGDDLMGTHNDMLGDCSVCHSSGFFPTFIGTSSGGTNLDGISCSGCHGRAQDGTGSGTEGYGAGLRQRHWNANRTVEVTTDAGVRQISTRICGECHQRADLGGLTDANPANFTPVGENIQPPYYADADGAASHPSMPQDPCSDLTNGIAPEEEFAGDEWALDNDGDTGIDTRDPDCGGLVVFLEYFRAAVEGRRGVMLQWKTTAEIDNVGFEVLRSTRNGPPVLVDFVPAQGDEFQGAEYELLDDVHLTPGTVVYFLRDVDVFGQRSASSQTSVEIRRAVGMPPGRARQASR